jgi:exportin-2 (importin alpha re-exporter)
MNRQATETYSFRLLNTLYACNPHSTLAPFLPTIFNLLLTRMQESVKESKKSRYCRLFLHSLCVFSAVYGPQALCDTLEGITSGLVGMLVMNIWSCNIDTLSNADDVEVKQTIVGATRLLVEAPLLQQKPDIWGSLLRSLWPMMGKTPSSKLSGDDFLLDDEEGGGGQEFDSAYSKLAYASIPAVDPCAEVELTAAPAFFATRLAAFLQGNGAAFGSLIPKYMESAEQTEALLRMLQQGK